MPFANSGQAEQPLGWREPWRRSFHNISQWQVRLFQDPAEGPFLGSLRNCLNILGLESSVLALLLAAWLLESLTTSLCVLFHACQNGDTTAALRQFASRNNQTEISWALGTPQILNNDKGINNDHYCLKFYSCLLIVLLPFIHFATFYFDIILNTEKVQEYSTKNSYLPFDQIYQYFTFGYVSFIILCI